MHLNLTAKLLLLAIVGCFSVTSALGQGKTFKIGAEFQAYPTGFIPGIRGDLFLHDGLKIHVRAGYNVVRHGDAGEHDDERGGGFGGTLGIDLLPYASHRWMIGARCDLWQNTVDWEDTHGIHIVQGTSEVTVLQPTLQAGVRLPLSETIEVWPSLSFGYEINVKTEGEEVGQGPILLGGVVVNFEVGRKGK